MKIQAEKRPGSYEHARGVGCMVAMAIVMVVAIHLSAFAVYLANLGEWPKLAGAVVIGLGAGVCWWAMWLKGMEANRWFDEAERLEFFAGAETELPRTAVAAGQPAVKAGNRAGVPSTHKEKRHRRRVPQRQSLERFRWLPRG